MSSRDKLYLACIGILIELGILARLVMPAERFTFFAVTGDSVKLVWSANQEPDLAGYRLYYQPAGDVPQVLSVTADTCITTKVPLSYFWEKVRFSLTAIDRSGNESAHSDTVSTIMCKEPRLVGDVTGDGRVNLWDKMRYMIAAGSNRGDMLYSEYCDLDGSGRVDLSDKMLMNQNAGR